ncbi:hypothetical protein ACVWZR_000228 [Bradyrhizobium sp. i1.3.1]
MRRRPRLIPNGFLWGHHGSAGTFRRGPTRVASSLRRTTEASVSAGRHLGRTWRELRAVFSPCHQGRALPVRRCRRNRDRANRTSRIHRRSLARSTHCRRARRRTPPETDDSKSAHPTWARLSRTTQICNKMHRYDFAVPGSAILRCCLASISFGVTLATVVWILFFSPVTISESPRSIASKPALATS